MKPHAKELMNIKFCDINLENATLAGVFVCVVAGVHLFLYSSKMAAYKVNLTNLNGL